MATRAAAFTAKIRNLKDYHYRMINSVSPLPSGVDIANTLKYFSQSLLQVLKDVPIVPCESYGPRQRDSIRLSVFPNLNYSGLYESVMSIIDVVPMVQQGQLALGEAVLNVIGCLVPFLEYDLLDTLPLTVAGTLAVFPVKLHKDIIEMLCMHLLPVTLGYAGMNANPTYATDSTASIMMMTFQYCEDGAHHSQILECIMSMKKNTFKDLLSVIAYGPPSSRAPAVHHLFHYWPQLNPAHSDRKGIHYKYTAWTPVNCQRENCPNGGNVKAVKMCLDPALAIQCGDKPPPLFVCVDCVDQLRREHAQFLIDLLRPLEKVSLICENKNCTSPKNQAISTCFTVECASYNGYRPIRYCVTCHENRHGAAPGANHLFHLTIPDVWSCEPDLQTVLVEAIVALLKEAQPLEEKRIVEMGEERGRHQHFDEDDDDDGDEADEHKLLSRYGVWLMVELCKPKDDVPIEILGRLLAMLFQWFDATAYLPDDNIGNALERLKPQYLYKWLQSVSKTHFEVILSCLLPHPIEYARVGGHWDTLSSRTSQIKEGLNRMFCLVPYDIITYEVWDYVMPFWLEAVRTEVPAEERSELKVLLSKSFDTEMCPLPFPVEKMYHFLLERFDKTVAAVQDQNLQWLQILTSLDIWIPEKILINMFKTGVKSLAHPPPVIDVPPAAPQLQQSVPPNVPLEYFPPGSPLSPSQFAEVFQFGPGVTEPEREDVSDVTNLSCFILMLDLVIMQVQIQEMKPHLGLVNSLSKDVMSLLTDMLLAEWEGTHTCDSEEDIVECRFCELSSLWHQLAAKLVEWIVPEKELEIPEKDLPKIEDAQHRTFTEKNRGKNPVPELEEESLDEMEKQFHINALPPHLKLLHALLQTLEDESDSDALFFLLKTMKMLCLHGECLNYAQKERRPFLKHCLAKRLIPNLWKLLQAEHSQIAIQCVPLLLHCFTLPTGADVLWKMVEDDFNNEDWRARFSAVEKVTVLARLLKIESIHNNQVIMTGLAHAFCYLIGCLNDTNTSIVERTTLYLETIKQSALRCMCQCMEFQFDSVISDRTLILQRLLLLQRILKDQEIFSWHFFLNRFDALCLEAQLDLESTGDITGLTDLSSSDRQSEHFLKKINRARFALARTDSVRSVSGSICAKPPYRRAASVPMHLVAKTQPPLKDKDKCPRQQSAPTFGRRDPRGSRFGLGMFSNYMFPGGQLREFTDEESNFAALLQRAMDLEGVDRETVHHLVTLLMKYMLQCDQERVNEDRDMSREQNIVLRHLNMLLGYNQTEKVFSAPPYKLRYSAVFNAYLAGLPLVLDRNFALGNIILPVSMALLQYVASPQRYASDYQPPNYSLWLLEPHCRIYWLQSLTVILYKYQYNIAPASNTIHTLVRITVNTIENQLHHCKRHDDTFGPASPMVTRNRDTSNVSVGDLENIQETDTPPQSPTDSQVSGGDTVMFNLSSSTAQFRRNARADSDVTEDTDRTLEQSVQEYMMQQARMHSRDELSAGPTSPPPDVPEISVDHKMIEQIQAFESQNGSKPKPAQSGSDQSSADAPDSTPTDEASEEKPAILFKNKKEKTNKNEQTAGENVAGAKTKTQDESPRKLKYPLGKARSAGLLEASNTDSGSSPEFAGVQRRPHRALSEKTPKVGGALHEKDEQQNESEQDETTPNASPIREPKLNPNYRQRKTRKTGLTTVELQKKIPELMEMASSSESTSRRSRIRALRPPRRSRKSQILAAKAQAQHKRSMPSIKFDQPATVDRCPKCHAVLEAYDEDVISMCIVALSCFIHREPALAASLLSDMLQSVARIAASTPYPWLAEISGLIIPGNCVSVARQFLRCVLHQLAPNGIFPQLFQIELEDPEFLKTLATALVDFADLNCYAALQLLLEGVNEMKNVTPEQMGHIVKNLATYVDYISMETSSPAWPTILTQFDLFFRRLPLLLPTPCDISPVLKIMIAVLKIPGLTSVKAILEPFSKLLTHTIQNCSFKLQQLLDICSLCNRAFTKERDKLYLSRSVIFELVQALKFKSPLPDENLLMLVQFVCIDSGGTIGPINISEELSNAVYNPYNQSLISTNAAECMKQNLSDCVEFISDLHTINKVKNNLKGGSLNLNEDTLGSHLKAGIAQFVALEFTRGNGRDNRAISRYMPWLYHPPTAMQQGPTPAASESEAGPNMNRPKEFIDCVGHIRLLSWLLLGSLAHTAITKANGCITCQPIPLEASPHIADHIMVIMTGFAEQSKASVLHMSSLFHAFFLCQLWTMYCESFAAINSSVTDSFATAHATVIDFWARVTPGILQLLSHSKVMSEMVNLHFLGLIEALQECNSTILSKLFPMWTPILFAYNSQLPGHMQVRLSMCQNWQPKEATPSEDNSSLDPNTLLAWLKRLQFKLGQIEVQSAQATQFYMV